ncbi:hypothetical protein AAC387_Pa03g2379 [Persea americana]
MVEGIGVWEHLLNKEQLFYDPKRRGFEPNIADLVRSIVSTLPPPWAVQDIYAKLKTNFVDIRELGEMLEEIESDLTTIKALEDLEDLEDLENEQNPKDPLPRQQRINTSSPVTGCAARRFSRLTRSVGANRLPRDFTNRTRHRRQTAEPRDVSRGSPPFLPSPSPVIFRRSTEHPLFTYSNSGNKKISPWPTSRSICHAL